MNSVTPIASLSATAGKLLNISADRADQTPGDLPTKPDISDLRRAVHTIERRSRGLLHFVDSYRTLTRIPKPDYRLVSVKDLIERIGHLVSSRPDINGVRITTQVDPESLEATVDPDLIEQVLINLSTNAIQALGGKDGAELSLTSRLNERGRVIIEVTDNGPGINEDVLESIFVPFFTTKPEGSGIGLSLSRQIMRLHKGELTAISTPGEKTVFTLRF
jgi:signal transduction histidine kinase